MTDRTADHAALMDATYRYQRLIYDATRAWYLLGRDLLIADLAPPPEARVLEIACGTGRNLMKIAARYPGRRLYGLDISRQMLRTAEAKLGRRAWLAEGDACRFDGLRLFDSAGFDRIVISYAVSMIPDWQGAIRAAAQHLAPGGTLHIVDFHDQAGLPRAFRRALWSWLARFHVTPRTDLAEVARRIAAETGCTATHRSLFRGYAQYVVIERP
ncbi:class I SAM-dependent methyltransferase [Rhodovulum euryhalinum]|uniref:S-adenosylmethionine-diacylgycerolhomoserine-N-methyltransferase n=1 Tax=Rhodovulum euryhalinum TaxID=35805 RepID=A0A4R2KKG2_9RHOB|nr:class I SAM-dependent methyltransferase [Rhodovulum euryhalinum]TCO74153.1 S-adenosylmethionine-diacylgycerolhomoserine-N-methyltransferase [Rhodovulum euryhalinum]